MNSNPLFLVSIIIFISSCFYGPCEARKHKKCIRQQCGSIQIPYPFGIISPAAEHCYYDPNFAITCNSSSSSNQSIPYLNKLGFEILEIRVESKHRSYGKVTVKIPTLMTTCSSTMTSLNLANSPFKYSIGEPSGPGNVLASVGCGGYALLLNETGGVIAGCTSVCPLNPPPVVVSRNRSRCNGYRCCQDEPFYEDITYLRNYSIVVSESTNNISGDHCRSAFMISSEYVGEAEQHSSSRIAAVPVVLLWELRYNDNRRKDGFEVAGIPLIICGGTWGCWRFKTKNKRKEIKLRATYFKDKLDVQGSSNSDVIKLFTIKELKKFTDNFNKDHVLGKGGQGTVYKGMLKDGQVIAVKRSTSLDEGQWKQFINEVILLSQIKHRHVVKILGCCLEDDVPLVVYEFISNGTLSEHIHNSIDDEFIFTWEVRLRIAFETATAISYLHSEYSTPLYHTDIKSSNILLDDKFIAKLSDFGISRAISVEQTHLTTCVQGTFGYLDPEYFYSGQYSVKSDVYSFGVLLAELLTGQKPIHAIGHIDDNEEIIEEEEVRSLAEYFVSSMNENKLFEIVDPLVLEGNNKEDIMEYANLAKQCLNPTGLERPTMNEATMVLERLRFRNSSCMPPPTPNDQAEGWTTRSSSMITSSMEIGNAFQRSVTYDHIDLTTNSDSAEVEMPLLHTC